MTLTTANKPLIIIGFNNRKDSLYSLEWTLDHMIKTGSFRIILLHVRASALSVMRFTGAGSAEVQSLVESNLKKAAEATVEQAKELCSQRKIFDYELVETEGDAKRVLCEAVKKHQADFLVVGSHRHGIFKRAMLGSVSDYCARHACCSVLIVKQPKYKYYC